MKRKYKILLIVLSIFVVLIGSAGGYILWRMAPPQITSEIVEMELPFIDYTKLDAIQAYGDLGYQIHNGIDYGINETTNIYAWCKLRVIGVKTWFNDKGGHWQTNVGFRFSWKYTFDVAFESWALNETYANYQDVALPVKIGQVFEQGDIIGALLNFGEHAHIHFGMKENGDNVCPYQYFSSSAKQHFDILFTNLSGDPFPCNDE